MFRKYAREVVMVTVLLFVLSLFGIGAYSYLNKGKNANKQEKDVKSNVALVNGKSIDEGRIFRQFNQIFSAIPQDKRVVLDPDIIDYYRYDAFQKTVSFMLMMDEAKKQGIKAMPQEVNYRIEQIAKMYELKGTADLKKILKERKIPWADFRNQQKEEIMVAKTVNGISGRVSVTPLDLKMAFTEIKTRHILIKLTSENEKADLDALKKAEKIYEAVLGNRASFAEIAKKFSDDALTAANGGDLGWISRGQMVPEFEKQLYKMQPGDIVGPIKTVFGYHIIQALERKDKPVPQGQSEKDIENQILQEKQGEAVRKWIKPLQDSANIVIMDSTLKAYEFRVKHEYLNALVEYQKLLASQPNNLLIYVQIARMYEKMDRLDESYAAFKKAMIWQKYNPQYQYPILYITFIDYLNKHNNKVEAKTNLDELLKLFVGNKVILETAVANYSALLSKKEIADVQQKIDVLKDKEKIAQEAASKQSTAPPQAK